MARGSWRARWRQQLLLAATLALVVGVVVSVVAGAEQASTAMDRLRAQTHASDVFFSVGEGDPAPFLKVAAATPGVVGATLVRDFYVRPKGSDLFPDYNLLAFAPTSAAADVSIDVPFIVEGRDRKSVV